ncbi:MAG: AraC family transcriptional regulator [Proteobacteria bacterium]|nr:AraC family transcriptional regulator [Pseudomonadota bacterium]
MLDPSSAATPPPAAAPAPPGISFDWARRAVSVKALFATDAFAVHRLEPGQQPHAVKMQRTAHTMLVFDNGSFSDGVKRIDGVPAPISAALDGGVDLVPAGVELSAWTGTRCELAVTIVSIDPARMDELIGEDSRVGVKLQARTDLLRALAARVRTWSVHGWLGLESVHAETVLVLMLQEFAALQRTARPATPRAAAGGLTPRAQRLVREFVSAHLDANIDLQRMAAAVGLSRYHFARSFKASFGVSPHQYVIQERVRKAAALMRGSRESITDIALSAGFAGSSELSRRFRQVMGCAPREFRAGLAEAPAALPH